MIGQRFVENNFYLFREVIRKIPANQQLQLYFIEVRHFFYDNHWLHILQKSATKKTSYKQNFDNDFTAHTNMKYSSKQIKKVQQNYQKKSRQSIFVSVSHQTGLDTRSITRKSIIILVINNIW